MASEESMAGRTPEPDPIAFLMNSRFPKLSMLGFPSVGTVQNLSPDGGREKLAEAERYRSELERLSHDEISALVNAEWAKRVKQSEEKAELDERRRFFNQASAVADLDHWSRASYWTIDEAVALTLGKNPKTVNLKTVAPHAGVSAFAKSYTDLHDLAKRAVWARQLRDPSYPAMFLAWAKRMDIAVPPELVAAVEERGVQIADWKSLYDELKTLNDQLQAQSEEFLAKYKNAAVTLAEVSKTSSNHIAQLQDQIIVLEAALSKAEADAAEKPLGTRERESLLKLVIGIAVEQYGYDPAAARNTATAQIASDLELIGVGLDDDTVLKWLREAADLLPRDWSAVKNAR